MGQRHQLFIIFTVKGKVVRIVLHNQWLYGCIALELLILLLKTIEEHVSPEDPTMCVEGTKQTILDKAKEKDCSKYDCIGWDPMCGDNNNGITVIDARDASHPKYCFMAIDSYTECLDARPEDVKRIMHHVVSEDEEDVYLPAPGYPLSASDYIDLHYHPEEHEPKYQIIARLKAALARYTVLTPAECFEEFPSVYEKVNVKRYQQFYKLHNDPREMAWERRKHFICCLAGAGILPGCASSHKGIIPTFAAGRQECSAMLEVLGDTVGLLRHVTAFL